MMLSFPCYLNWEGLNQLPPPLSFLLVLLLYNNYLNYNTHVTVLSQVVLATAITCLSFSFQNKISSFFFKGVISPFYRWMMFSLDDVIFPLNFNFWVFSLICSFMLFHVDQMQWNCSFLFFINFSKNSPLVSDTNFLSFWDYNMITLVPLFLCLQILPFTFPCSPSNSHLIFFFTNWYYWFLFFPVHSYCKVSLWYWSTF